MGAFFLTTLPPEPEAPKRETRKRKPLPPPDPTFLGRLYHGYADEWGLQSPPADPNAPPGRRPGWFPPAPETSPPYPFTEWSYGGSEVIGAALPNSIDSPFMKALAPTAVGKFARGLARPGLWLGRSGLQHQHGAFYARRADRRQQSGHLFLSRPTSSSSTSS